MGDFVIIFFFKGVQGTPGSPGVPGLTGPTVSGI